MKLQDVQPQMKVRLDYTSPEGGCVVEGTVGECFNARITNKTYLTIYSGGIKNSLTIPANTEVVVLTLDEDDAK